MNRTDISEKLKESLKCDTLLLVGDKSSFLHTTETMYQAADTTKTSILRLDDVGDVLVESPGKVAQSILLFCQGMGLLTSASSSERLVRLSNFQSLLFYSNNLKLRSCQLRVGLFVVCLYQVSSLIDYCCKRTVSNCSNDGEERRPSMSMGDYDRSVTEAMRTENS